MPSTVDEVLRLTTTQRVERILPTLTAWAELYARLQKNAAKNGIRTKTKLQKDKPKGRSAAKAEPETALQTLWRSYTESISAKVGDTDDWLFWYFSACDMGRDPQIVSTLTGKTIKVRTLRQLARVITY